MTTKFDFKPASEKPTVEGEYILLSKCSGYILANAHFDDQGSIRFCAQFGAFIEEYDYWAKIEECHDAAARLDI